MFFFLSADNFQCYFYQLHIECQTVGTQIRCNVLSGLIWEQTVCDNAEHAKSK